MQRHNPNALPIACSLDRQESGKRQNFAAEVLGRVLQVREMKDGYEFTFPGDGQSVYSMIEMVIAERECCPFLTFGVDFEAAGGPVRLRVTGPDGAKEFIQEELGLSHNTD